MKEETRKRLKWVVSRSNLFTSKELHHNPDQEPPGGQEYGSGKRGQKQENGYMNIVFGAPGPAHCEAVTTS